MTPEQRNVYDAMSMHKSDFLTTMVLRREEFAAVAVYKGKVAMHTALQYPPETHRQDGDIWTEMRLAVVPDGVARSFTQLPWSRTQGCVHKSLVWSMPEALAPTAEMFGWWVKTVLAETADLESLDGKTMKEVVEIIKPRPLKSHP